MAPGTPIATVFPTPGKRTRGLDLRDPADANRIVPAGGSEGEARHRGYPYLGSSYLNELADGLVPR